MNGSHGANRIRAAFFHATIIIMNNIREALKEWRKTKAFEEGVELFRILSNQAIEEIASLMPTTKTDLLKIKGFKEKKYQKYGADILGIMGVPAARKSQSSLFGEPVQTITPREVFPHQSVPFIEKERPGMPEEKIFTVTNYLDLINVALLDFKAKVKGEISSLDIRGNYLFFGLKDKEGEGMMNCFMWQSNYRISGVPLEEGMEIVVYGFPEVYKPRGTMTMRVETVELVGEGALKKAYEVLKAKLEQEGIFAEERKRPVPEYLQKIGLITSRTGAVIHDFLNNLGKFGYKIQFFDSRVEGTLAVKDLLRGIKYFRNKDIDALVIIRGGGSLESLQAFNNEMLVREIAKFPKPVLCGIGHDKDVPLISLACDKAASTPTAVTHLLNKSWQEAVTRIHLAERDIMNQFQTLFDYVRGVRAKLLQSNLRLAYGIKEQQKNVQEYARIVLQQLANNVNATQERIRTIDQSLKLHNPEYQLRLGYSIATHKGKVLRSIQHIEKGDRVDIKVADGTIETEVNSTKS